MAMYRFRATVKGSGQFPHDMLRYDGCYPAEQRDALEMGRSWRDTGREPREVQVIAYNDRKVSPFTDARWASFGWQVIKVEALGKALGG